jgi:hypothetical protein
MGTRIPGCSSPGTYIFLEWGKGALEIVFCVGVLFGLGMVFLLKSKGEM